MAGLITSQGYQLTPNVAPIAQRIGQLLQQKQQEQRQGEAIAKKEQAIKIKDESLRMALELNRIKQLPDNISKRTAIAKKSQEIIAEGGDPSRLTALLETTNPDELNMGLQKLSLEFGDAGKMFDQMIKTTEPAKTYEPVLDAEGNIVAQRDVQTGKVIKDPRAEARAKAAEVGVSEVQSSKILPGGITQIVRRDGTVEVIEPDALSKEIVKRAEDRGVDLQQKRAQGRSLGKDAAKIATKVFDRAGKLRANNRTLRKIITEVEAGAETGPLAAQLPSMRAASVKLDQLRSELGLDVVGSVTFGALSEGELNLAMSTALPTKLEGPELTKWANDKIRAQEKLVDYLEDQAIFLSEKGNTPAMWLQQQRERAPKAEPTAQPSVVQPAAPQGAIKFLGFE